MKKLILFIIALIIVGGGAFYGGMKYAENKISSQRTSFQNLSPEQRQQFVQRRGTSANFLSGEVISKDEKSLTIKLPDGSTKIVFFSDSTQISKTTEGSINDIEIGKPIMVSGDQNPDGSVTAKTIQLSPRYLIPKK
ncbi:MAG: hypothetical protein ACP5PR_01280 [Minisyncoccia bacterium]